MQNFQEANPGLITELSATRQMSGAVLLFAALTLIVLAFIPLVPPDDAIKGGGITLRGGMEFAFILIALSLMAAHAQQRNLFIFDFKNPTFVIISLFVGWSVLSGLWSPNPILSVAKGAELWAITIAAIMFVTLVRQSVTARNQIEARLLSALITVLCLLIVANTFFWGTPLPSSGDESLPLHLLGEEPFALAARPRLLLAYAHPLLTGDFLALSVVCLFATAFKKRFKAIGLGILFALLWMADARGPSVALLAALGAMTVLKLRRNSVRALALILVVTAGLAVAMIFQDSLLKPINSLLSDDVYTLNSRTELWPKAFSYIAQEPVTGYGYYSSRYLLMKDFIWAGHAHNSFIELLLTTGLVGLVLALAYLFYVGRVVRNSRDGLLLGTLIYTLIQGMLNPLLFTPGLPMFVLLVATLSAGLNVSGQPSEKPLTCGWEANL